MVEWGSWAWPVAAAPFVGSFLGVVVTRAETPAAIIVGRSACPACGARLGPLELVPVLSWIALRGICRHCAQPIASLHLVMELAAIAVAGWAALVATDPGALWVSVILGWVLLALAAIDFRLFLLPDFLTLPLIGLGLLAAWAIEPDALEQRAIGAAAGLIFIVAIRALYKAMRGREGIGLGDAKLLAAAGAWVGWMGLPSTLLLAALSGLVYAIAARRAGGAALSADDRVPFGAFIGLGLWVVWLYGPLAL